MLWRARLIHPLPTAPLVLEGTRRRGQGVNKSGANRETSNCPLNRGRSRLYYLDGMDTALASREALD
jgi:hypothetical protein